MAETGPVVNKSVCLSPNTSLHTLLYLSVLVIFFYCRVDSPVPQSLTGYRFISNTGTNFWLHIFYVTFKISEMSAAIKVSP